MSTPALSDPVEGMTDLTTSISQIEANDRNANPCEIRNRIRRPTLHRPSACPPSPPPRGF